MARVLDIADTVERRVRNADYRVRQFPSLTELAAEMRANPRTVRKALQHLVQRGVLHRLPTGRIDVPPQRTQSTLHVALLVPASPTPWIATWHRVIERLALARGWTVKLVGYTHWHDVSIPKALRGFEGVFFMPLGDDVPPEIIRMIKSGRRVVVLEEDTSAEGVPCLRLTPPAPIQKLLDLMAGHDGVSCLNTQPMNRTMRERIEQWQLWKRKSGKKGRLLNEPVELFGSPMEQACRVVREHLEAGDLGGTGLFCVTGAAALGAMRALKDHGLWPGREVAVASGDDDAGRAPFAIPSISCVGTAAWDPYLDVCLDWFAGREPHWVGPLLVQPAEVPIFKGESTGP